MVELNHYNRQRKAYRKQIEYDRARSAAMLRDDAPPPWKDDDEEGDEMGDSFSVAGDTTTTHNHYYPKSPEPASPPPDSPPQTAPAWKTAALIAAGVLGGAGLGAGIPWLAGAYRGAETTINESQDLGVGVEVVPGGAQTETNNGG